MEGEAFGQLAQLGTSGAIAAAFMAFLWRGWTRERNAREALEKEYREHLRQQAEKPTPIYRPLAREPQREKTEI